MLKFMLFQIPFEEDVKNFVFSGFKEILQGDEDETQREEDERASKQQVCDNLIDSMMLDNDVLCSEKIPSPFHTAFNKTILQRSVRTQEEGLVKVRGDAFDRMVVPPSVLQKAKPHHHNIA